MADIPGTTRAQTIFLRACAKDPIGLCGKRIPSARMFRRWMQRPRFRQEVEEIREALQMQADVQLAVAASAAARLLSTLPAADGGAEAPQRRHDLGELLNLLKLAHARERLNVSPQMPEIRERPRVSDAAIIARRT